MTDKIKIEAPEQMSAAMGAMQTSAQLLGSFDWDTLLKAMEFGEGVGAVLDPGTAKDIYADPQWEIKKRLFRAAANFMHEFEAVGELVK